MADNSMQRTVYPPDKKWTVNELAERCEVVPLTIWRRIWDGKLGCIQIGRSIRIPEFEFQRFLRGEKPENVYRR